MPRSTNRCRSETPLPKTASAAEKTRPILSCRKVQKANGTKPEHGTWDPFVIYEDGLFKMWYRGNLYFNRVNGKSQANILGKGGGYIVAPAHHIQDNTPLENIFALFEAVKELG